MAASSIPNTIKEAYPNGYELIAAQGKDLGCGLHALENSFRAQCLQGHRIPTLKELRKIAGSATVQELKQTGLQPGQDYGKNYLVDHLALILRLWGEENGYTIYLGIVWRDGGDSNVLSPAQRATQARVYWIHNDGPPSKGGLGHYSGIQPLSIKEKSPVIATSEQVEANTVVDPLPNGTSVDFTIHNSACSVADEPSTEDPPNQMETSSIIEPIPAASVFHKPYVSLADGPEPEIIPRQRKKINRVYEFFASRYCYPAINRKVYGKPIQCTLSGNNASLFPTYWIELVQSQKCLPGGINFKIKCNRDLDVESNPQRIPIYQGRISIDAKAINNYQVHLPNKFKVPEYFNKPTDWDPKDICLVSFTVAAKDLLFLNPEIPVLSSKFSQAALSELFKDLGLSRQKPLEQVKFEVLTTHFVFDEETNKDFFLTSMGSKIASDKLVNPLHSWMKDSPYEHQLRGGNIIPIPLRPKFTDENIVLQHKNVFAERLAFLVPHIYAVVDEHIQGLSLAIDIAETNFSATFTAIPKSEFKSSKYDNDEPKCYLMYMKWPKDLDFPTEGDHFKVQMPFEVPACPEAPAEEVHVEPNEVRPEEANDFGTEDNSVANTDSGDSTKNNKVLDEKQKEYAERMRKEWDAYVLAPTALNPDGQPLFMLVRPSDILWEGKKEDCPTVGTKIPVSERKISLLANHKKYIISDYVAKTDVTMQLVISDQTFKDLVNQLNNFVELENIPEFNGALYAHHLAEYLIKGDSAIPYPVWRMWEDMHPGVKEVVFSSMLHPNQARDLLRFDLAFHGTFLIEGVPAAGKTFVALCFAVGYLWKYMHETDNPKQILLVTDTNAGVNDLAVEFISVMKKIMGLFTKEKLQPLKIVRVHSLEIEKDKFIAHFITPKHRQYFGEDIIKSSTLVEQLMDNVGVDFQKKKGDPRFDPRLEDVWLHSLMLAKMKSEPSNENWHNLRIQLLEKKKNPDDTAAGWTAINQYIGMLRTAVLTECDCIVTTCALAMRNALVEHSRATLLIKDEDARSLSCFTPSIVAAHARKLEHAVYVADSKQKGPSPLIARRDGNSAFSNYLTRTSFEQFKSAGAVNVFLRTQFRMHNPDYVRFLSDNAYNGAMSDGNAHESKKPLPETLFAKKCMRELFKIDNNVVMISLADTHCRKEDGSESSCNDKMNIYVMQIINKLLAMVDAETEIELDKSAFKIRIESTYKGVINAMKKNIAQEKLDRVFANTIETIQGLGEWCVFRINPTLKMSDFAGNARDNLVADSRFKHLYIYVITQESLDPTKYGLDAKDEVRMADRHDVGITYKTSLFFKQHDSFYTDSVTEEQLCYYCRETGHIKENCPRQVAGDMAACANCGSLDHTTRKCDLPNVLPPVICSICKAGGHFDESCPSTMICNKCKEVGHKKQNCPTLTADVLECFGCGETGHKRQDCPTAKCFKCDETGHLAKNCTLPYCGKCKTNAHDRNDCPENWCNLCKTKGHRAKSEDCNFHGGKTQTNSLTATQISIADMVVNSRQFYYKYPEQFNEAHESVFSSEMKFFVKVALDDLNNRSLKPAQEALLLNFTAHMTPKLSAKKLFDDGSFDEGTKTSFFLDKDKSIAYFTNPAVQTMEIPPKLMKSGFVVTTELSAFKAWKFMYEGQLRTTWVVPLADSELSFENAVPETIYICSYPVIRVTSIGGFISDVVDGHDAEAAAKQAEFDAARAAPEVALENIDAQASGGGLDDNGQSSTTWDPGAGQSSTTWDPAPASNWNANANPEW